MFKKIKLYSTAIISISAIGICSDQAALAQNYNGASEKDWRVTVGAAVGASPIYEGGGDYAVTPFPYINLKWKDRVSLGMGGLTADILKKDTTKIGAGLVYHGGRDEDGDTLFHENNDNSLQGMGDIDGALGAKVYASYDFEPITLSGGVTQYFGNDNEGLVVDTALSKRFPINDKLNLTPSISTTWADDEYMDTFFSVNAAQNARSRFGRYGADAGFKDVSVGVNAIYMVDDHWFVTGNGKVKRLLGDAADSPISQNDTSVSAMSSIGYNF